jgi:hypothetical protein
MSAKIQIQRVTVNVAYKAGLNNFSSVNFSTSTTADVQAASTEDISKAHDILLAQAVYDTCKALLLYGYLSSEDMSARIAPYQARAAEASKDVEITVESETKSD